MSGALLEKGDGARQAESVWDDQDTLSSTQKQRYIIDSRQKMGDLKVEVAAVARQNTVTEVAIRNYEKMILEIKGLIKEYLDKYLELTTKGEKLALQTVSSKIASMSDVLNTKLDGEKMKLRTEVQLPI